MWVTESFQIKEDNLSHKEIARINQVIQVCLTLSQNVRSLIQKKIHIQQNLNKGLEYS